MSPPIAISTDVTMNGVMDTGVTVSKSLTTAGVLERRAKGPPFKAGVAAPTSSDQFKSKVGLSHHKLLLEGLENYLHLGHVVDF